MNTLEAIKTRRSIRNFNSKPVEKEHIQTVLEAGALAPVGAEVQVFCSVIRNSGILKKLAEAAIPVMQKEPGFDPFYGAATVIIASAEPHPIGCDLANAACAAENMLLAATDLGLSSIYLLGFVLALKENAQLQKEAGIPEGKIPLLGVALGYSDEPALPPRSIDGKNVVFID